MVERFIFWLLLFLLPTQLGYHFWPDFSFIFGIKVDYLAPTIYLTDILLFFLFVLSAKKFKNFFSKRMFLFLLPISLFALANIFFAPSPIAAGIKWLKVLELLLFGFWVFLNQKLILKKETVWVLFFSILAFSLIGLKQFILQKTLGGPFSFLGERTFSKATPGIALVSLLGREFVRVYSTFSHPNSFAGFLLVSILILLALNRRLKVLNKKTLFLFLAISLLVFLLTFSFGAYLGAILLILCYLKILSPYPFFFLSVIASLFLPLFSFLINPSLFAETVRLRLVQAALAGKIFSASPVFGVGLNNFFRASFSLQPVHNIFLLVLTEGGLGGLFLVSYLFFYFLKKCKNILFLLAMVFVLVTGFFDHYWLTLQQNQLLLAFLLGISLPKKNN